MATEQLKRKPPSKQMTLQESAAGQRFVGLPQSFWMAGLMWSPGDILCVQLEKAPNPDDDRIVIQKVKAAPPGAPT